MKTLIAIPMKDPAAAKTRLGSTLPSPARQALARTLFRNTLRVVSQLDSAPDVLVVTASAPIKAIAEGFGARVLADPGGGLNAALDAAAQDATRSGYDRLIVLPGDLADPKADEIAQLLALPSQEGSAVVAPSYDGGTNALVLNPPSGFTFRYGPNSSAAHEKAARDAGRAVVIAPFASLRHDVDVAADLNAAVVRRIGQGLGGDR